MKDVNGQIGGEVRWDSALDRKPSDEAAPSRRQQVGNMFGLICICLSVPVVPVGMYILVGLLWTAITGNFGRLGADYGKAIVAGVGVMTVVPYALCLVLGITAVALTRGRYVRRRIVMVLIYLYSIMIAATFFVILAVQCC